MAKKPVKTQNDTGWENGDTPDNAPDPFDPEKLTLKGNPSEGFGVNRVLAHVPVRKPNKQEFFRTHIDSAYRCVLAVLVLQAENETYLVTPDVAAAIPGEIKAVELVTCVNRQGLIFLWPVPILADDGRSSDWHVTARKAAERAESMWVRMVANRGANGYDIYEAPGIIAEPDWPDHTFKRLLEVAFGNGRLIDREDHPVLKQLLGRE